MRAREFFEGLEARVVPERLAGIDHTYRFEIEGEGTWLLVVRHGNVEVTEGAAGDGVADATISTSAETFDGMTSRRQNPLLALATRELRVTGDTGAAVKLQKLF